MSVKSHAKKSGNVAASWLKKREEIVNKKGENKTVVDYFERQTEAARKNNGIGNITARIKETGLKLKNTIKTKLADDEKTTEYTITNIDKRSGIVTLKNERGTVRKVSMFDSVFDKK